MSAKKNERHVCKLFGHGVDQNISINHTDIYL